MVVIAGWWAAPLVRIGVAYKAKSVCSGLFVSHRPLAQVLGDIEADDLWPLQYISASVDRQSRVVTSSAVALVTQRAVYREGLGCSLVFDEPAPSLLAEGPHEEGQIDARPERSLPGASSRQLDAVVMQAFAEPESQHQRRTRAIVVIRDGQVIAERYSSGIDAGTPLIGWSMAKSVLNALVGVLVGDRRLHVDGPAAVPEWSGADDPRRAISLGDLLRMSSGLRFDEDGSSRGSDTLPMLLRVRDSAGFAIAQPLVAKPGTHWHYSNGSSNIIAKIIRHTLSDDREYLSFPRRELFDRIGMRHATLETDAGGTFVASSYAFATAREWARFGELYLHDGVWENRRILPEGWVTYSRSPAPADPARRYGAHFWLKVPDEYCVDPAGVPDDAFHAIGHEGQFVTIIPSHQMVIVRLGVTRYPGTWDHCGFVRTVIDALGESSGAPS